MGASSKIEWTRGTFSPWTGCAKVSPGCANCYAETWALRTGRDVWGPRGQRQRTSASYWRQAERWNAEALATGERWRVFPSLCDPFEDRPEVAPWRAEFLALVERTPGLDWLLLTKRPEHVRAMVPPAWLARPLRTMPSAGGWPRNAWLGTSVENQEYADLRLPELLAIDAAIPVRFVSYEPALGPVDFAPWIERIDHCTSCGEENPSQGPDRCPECKAEGSLISTWGERDAEMFRSGERYEGGGVKIGPRLDWIIVGGESGGGARPFDLAWARATIAQCRAAGVACFVKQFGARPFARSVIDFDERTAVALPAEHPPAGGFWLKFRDRKGGDMAEWPLDLRERRFPEVRP